MIKKLFLALLGIVFATSVAFAAPVNVEILSETTLDNSPTNVTSSVFNIQDYSKVGFFVNYDETQKYKSVSATVTLEVSYDGTNFATGGWYDFAGSTSLQTSESITADGYYYCWFDPNANIPYVRVKIVGVNTDADNSAIVSATMAGVK